VFLVWNVVWARRFRRDELRDARRVVNRDKDRQVAVEGIYKYRRWARMELRAL
jgi:hypothetical protein